MDAREMQYQFEQRIAQLGEPIGREFNSFEIEDYLNQAQETYFLNDYNDFEKREAVRKSLFSLVKTCVIDTFTSSVLDNLENGYFVTLPGDFLYALEEEVTYNGNSIMVKPTTHDRYTINKNNPFKKPYSDLVWRLDADGKHELITDGAHTMSNYKVRYLSALPDIVINTNTVCVLNTVSHNKIVDIAVGLALRKLQLKNMSNEKINE